MGKKKRWQFYLIIAVVVLTIYNILPTIFFYSKPLKSPINYERATEIAGNISKRINALEDESVDWLQAYCSNLKIKPSRIQLMPNNPRQVEVTFDNEADINTFSQFWPQAGNLIPFAPSRLALNHMPEKGTTSVLIRRTIGIEATPDFLTYAPVNEEGYTPSELFKKISYERTAYIAKYLAGSSASAKRILSLNSNALSSEDLFFLNNLSDQITQVDKLLSSDKEFTNAFLYHILRAEGTSPSSVAASLSECLKAAESKSHSSTSFKSAKSFVQNHIRDIENHSSELLSWKSAFTTLAEDKSTSDTSSLSLNDQNAFFSKLVIDWSTNEIHLKSSTGLAHLIDNQAASELSALKVEAVRKMLYHEAATLSQETGEHLTPNSDDSYLISLTETSSTQSFLAMDLKKVANQVLSNIQTNLNTTWRPTSKEFTGRAFPIFSYSDYQKTAFENKQLGLVLFAPVNDLQSGEESPFKRNSLYIIAKGLQPLFSKIERSSNPDEVLAKDLQSLGMTLYNLGFIQYSPDQYGFPKEFKNDLIFELPDYFTYLTKASREDFHAYPASPYAILEFSDVESRIRAENTIDDGIHEDLLLWRDEYQRAQVDSNAARKFEIPPPTRSPLWSNFSLSFKKYFRGDTRKTLAWGMDLSGGKTVQIGLRDHQNQPVTKEADLKEAVNELYQRLNRLGVTEVTPHIEGSTIVVDFPGSQDLSASELINSSSMTFNVVNERFAPPSTQTVAADANLQNDVQAFLQDVWNEALVTSRTEVHEINLIAFNHFQSAQEGSAGALNSSINNLYNSGLRIANPNGQTPTSAFDDTLSSVSRYRGSDPSSWKGQTHPLVIIFQNYALQGKDIDRVRADYSPSEGNTLNFEVKSSYTNKDGETFTPQKDFAAWTTPFASSKIVGTEFAKYNSGQGWRMVTILNGSVINMASIKNPLNSNVQVTGNFSQSEVNKLVADLRAGSLSFTPEILAETNVSPELGKAERQKGITAAVIGLLLVIGAMIWFYRFGGVVASAALIFNLLIIWGVLQNIHAALTLEGIAAVILTMGMAVDANVLVFERIREEFAKTKRISQAVHAGYRRAFTAIFDSNLTTIIAAIILLNFDSGPIKGFALTLIIGIVSSMFTSLFMTRYFFTKWIENPCHKALNMSSFVSHVNFNFLGKAKIAALVSLCVLIIGGGLLATQKSSLLGMDFTGGYALSLTIDEKNSGTDYRHEVAEAFIESGASENNFLIRTLNKPNQLRVQFAKAMELDDQPFSNLDELAENTEGSVGIQNPKIVWVLNTLENAGLKLQTSSLNSIESNWVSMSGQLSDTMRNEALIGLILAMVCILIYITFRFEFKYAVSAIVALAHDCLVTLAIFSILRTMGVSLQINLPVIAAIMTIIGYSLNDTIIIFDRIREDLGVYRKLSFAEVINRSINATLGRTLLTSGTTLLVLLALLMLGGSAIMEFTLVMTIGVLVGTFSSIYVASPVMLFFHKKEDSKK